MQLHGIHHLTAVTADAPGNHRFYTGVLGMRLVKRTVNQDDVSAYHLFYADGEATPGSDITFFEWPVGREGRGGGGVTRTALRVAGRPALEYWAQRLAAAEIPHAPIRVVDGRAQLEFEDPEGQRLSLLDDGGAGVAHPWAASPVPAACQIRGLGPITVSVARLEPTERFLTGLLEMRVERRLATADAGELVVFAMGEGGPAAELHVRVEPALAAAHPGAGGVHHVAFRMADDEYEHWVDRYRRLGVRSSGPVDRFYFRSLYAREPGGLLVELATDGPGFATDEPIERLGERLSLPPFLESRRDGIERGLRPF